MFLLINKHTIGPNLNYKFIDELSEEFDALNESYIPEIEMQMGDNPGQRDDFRFLYGLSTAFQHYKENRKLPNISWRSLPSFNGT